MNLVLSTPVLQHQNHSHQHYINPTLESDGTALHLAEMLRSRGVAVSRLARGLPSGGRLEHASKAVLSDAIAGRRRVE